MSPDAPVRRRRLLWVLAAIVVAIVVVLAAIVLFVDVSRFEGPIERAIAEATGWSADVGGLDLSLARGLALTASPVTITAPGDASRIGVETIAIDAELWPLLRGELRVRSVSLIRPEIVLVRNDVAEGWVVPRPDPGGGGSADAAGRPEAPPASTGSPAPTTGAPPEEDAGPIDVSIEAVGVRDGRVVLDDRAADPPMRIELAEVDLDLAPEDGTLAGAGTLVGGGDVAIDGVLGRDVTLRLAGLPTEQLHPFVGSGLVHGGGALDGEIHVTFPLRIEGTVRGSGLTLLAGTEPFAQPVDLGFAIATEGERWTLERMTLAAGEMKVEGAGALLPDVALDLRVPETPLATVLSASKSFLPLPLDLSEPGSVRADARVEVPSGGALAYTAEGTLSAARYVISDALPAVDDVRAAFTLDRSGELLVDILSGNIAGGPVDGRARIDSIDPPGTLTLDGSIENAVLGGLLAPFVSDAASTVRGPTGLDADLRLDLSRATDLRALGGSLTMNSREASVPGWDLESAIRTEAESQLARFGDAGELLRGLLGGDGGGGEASPSGAASAASEALQEVFDSLDAKVDFDRFPWAVERLALAASGVEASGNGTFDPIDGVVDFALRATLDRERTAELVRQVDQVKYLVGDDGRLTLPVVLRGPMLRPSIGIDLTSVARDRIGASPQDAAKKTLQDEAEDKVRGLLGDFLKKKDDDRP